MGYGILRGQKIKLDGIKGMEIHILRERKSRSNLDIDTDKSKDNYAIIALEDKLNVKVARRTEELPGQRTKTGKLRKIQNNAVRMYDFIITGTHEDIIQIDYENYFVEAVNFMKRKFGEKNVMYAQVHLDERTPHLHLGLVPEYKGKLAAYQLFTPESMRKLQDEFYEQVSSRYGLERGEVFEETEKKEKRKHKTAVELKSETLAEVNRQQENLERLRSDVADAERQRLEMLRILEDLQQETDKKKKECEKNKLLADNQERRFYDLYNDFSAVAEDLENAKTLIELSKVKETEYNVTNFLLLEAEKDLKDKNKELEVLREAKQSIMDEVDEKLLSPIKEVVIAYDNKKDFVSAFKNFIHAVKKLLPKIDLLVQNYKKPRKKNYVIKQGKNKGGR